MQKRVILHIDFDSFFASVEQQMDPRLRNKPMGVTAQNGRNCIIASSREAKRLGIKTATPAYIATQICPSIILVPADFRKYWEVSKKFLKICSDYSPYVEMFSIDEVFIDITYSLHLYGGTHGVIEKIKSRIQKEIGEYITASIGISYNKLLAKLASGLAKPARHASQGKALRAGPNGVVEINLDNLDEVYKTAKLTDICGIGPRIGLRLNKIGIYTLLQLRSASLLLLIAEFGSSEAEFLYQVGRGIDHSFIIPYTAYPLVKSVSRNYCLPQNEYNQRLVLQNIYELCEEVGLKLRNLGVKAKTIGLSLKGERSEHGRVTGNSYLDCGPDLFSVCKWFYTNWHWKEYVRMISIWAENLEHAEFIPVSLFDQNGKKERLVQAIDTINKKFGDHTIRNGFLLYSPKLTTVPNGYGTDKYERAKLALDPEMYAAS